MQLHNNNLTALSKNLSRWLTLIVLLFPLLSLLGHYFAIPVLTGAIADLPTMRPSTAAGLLCLSLGIFLTTLNRHYRLIIFLTALFCVVLGSFTLTGNLLPFPGSPTSPQSALNFLLLGLSLLIYNFFGRFIRQAQVLIIVAGINSEIAFAGHIFGVDVFYGFLNNNSNIGMAVPTAVSFILASVALICAEPAVGFTKMLFRDSSASSTIARKLFLTIIFGPLIIGALTHTGMFFGLYRERVHNALFVIILISVIIRVTWQSAKQSEAEELRAEKALEEKQMLAAFVENSLDFVGITDAQQHIIYLNPAGKKMIGMPLDFPIESTNTADYYAPEDVAFAHDVVLRSVTENGRWQGETQFRHWISNQPIPVWHSYFQIRDQETKKILGTGTITRDMTYRKALEDELRLSEAKSSGIISISADAIISIDKDQNIILFNEGAETIFGYKKNEIQGKHLNLLIPERFRTRHQQHVGHFSTGPNTSRRMGERGVTIYGLRKNGEEFPAEAAISKIDVGGNLVMTVTLRDVTERVRRDNNQQFLADVSAALSEGLILESTLQRLAELVVKNLATFCILDIANAEQESHLLKVVSRTRVDGALCSECERMTALIKSSPSAFAQVILKTHQPLLIENITDEHLALLSANEEQLQTLKSFHLTSLLSVPMVAHNKFIGTLVMLSSTFQQQYRDSDLRLAEELAARAALSIVNSNLYHKAQNAIAIREDILAVVSHDLKNPLTTIKLIGQTLQLLENPDKATCSRLASKIENSARQMQVLIDDLLDFAKIESGTFAVNQKNERLMDAVRETIEPLQIQADAKKQSLLCEVAIDLPNVNIDRPRIIQVLSNLISNALKFTPEHGTIRISAQARPAHVVVSVSDTGPGIPPENLSKIFDRFWQAEEAKQKGSGLGLAIAKGIVVAHGGKIWAESKVGSGTTLYFTLPKSTEALQSPGVNANLADKQSQLIDLSKPVLKGEKILVVDDSPDTLFLIKHLLESLGAEVTVAESVKSALSNIKFSMPNILFTDIEMPEQTGYDLLDQLRHSPDSKSKSIPVIALTAHSQDKELSQIKKAGFDFYLSKPVNLEKMISTILQFTKH